MDIAAQLQHTDEEFRAALRAHLPAWRFNAERGHYGPRASVGYTDPRDGRQLRVDATERELDALAAALGGGD